MMIIATLLYLTNFVKTLFIIVVIYFVGKFIFRWLIPVLLQHTVKNMQQKMEQNMRDQQRSYRREGEVTIENNKTKKSTIPRDEGEYVDFTEIK